MAESDLIALRKALNFKKLQLDAIYEFSSALQSNSTVEDILRIFFSILMGPLGLTRAFFFDKKKSLFRKKGFPLTQNEAHLLSRQLKNTTPPFTCVRVQEIPDDGLKIKKLLVQKGVHHLINISENRRDSIILGLGDKYNRDGLIPEDEEYVFFLSRFMLIALSNVFFLKQLLEKKRLEYEVSIARNIQRSLLPQQMPLHPAYDIAVVYEPIREVGGDYYDFFYPKKHTLTALLADVEGKGLPAALLAASSQAIFHTMNQLYLFQPAKFMQKANDLISEMTRGQQFITLLWLLLDAESSSLTYVNAGHNTPYLLSDKHIQKLDRGGLFMGFMHGTAYEQETLPFLPGDIIVAFTDGVLEVQNREGREFGEQAIIEFIQEKKSLPAAVIAEKLYKRIKTFSHREKFRDDFTVLLIKSMPRSVS